MKPWPIRTGLIALLFLIALRGGEQAATPPMPRLARARTVLEQAGYRVQLIEAKTWGARNIPGDTFLSARHPLCSAAIEVRQGSIANVIDPARQVLHGITPTFAFGEWSGPVPSSPRLLLEAIRLQARYALSFGKATPPDSRLLAIIDPSACLAFTSPAWADAF